MPFIDRQNDRFQPGTPVFGSRFCGREAAIEHVLLGHRHAIWVLALRHFGKTSLLLELQYRTQDPRFSTFTPLYVSLAGVRALPEVARALTSAIEASSSLLAQHGVEPAAAQSKDSAVTILRALLRSARAARRSVLLLLDDGEAIVEAVERDAVGAHRLFKTLAAGRGLRTCLAADPLLGRLSTIADTTSPLLGDFLPPLLLGAFGQDELQPMLSPALDATPIRLIAAASGGHPYLTQLLASQCSGGLTVEQACLRLQNDTMVRDEVLGSLRSLGPDELRWLGALARVKVSSDSDVPFPRLIELGLVHRAAPGAPPAIVGRLLRDWLAGNVPSSIQPLPVPQASVGPFELLELIAQGGMSQVYRAIDCRDGRELALKLLNMAPSPELRARFVREACASLRLSHPGIVQLYEAGEADGRCYLAMELCQGRPLRERLAEGPMPPDQVLRAAVSLADALAHAHALGIVHRDIKPSNILLGPDGMPKILDFGLAKLLRTTASSALGASLVSLTGAGTLLGTVAYMSPEQAQGIAVDDKTDQFSFGIVLYEMLVGRHPFQAPSTYRLVHRLVHEPPAPLGDVAADTPFLLQVALDRLLQKNPADRFASLVELVELVGPLATPA